MNTATNDQFVTGGSVFVFPLSSRLCSGPPVLNQIGSAGYYLIKRVDPPFISLVLQRGPDTKTEPVRPAEGRTLQLCSSAALLSVSNDVTFETWCRHQSRPLSEALSALESEFQIHEPVSRAPHRESPPPVSAAWYCLPRVVYFHCAVTKTEFVTNVH